MIIFAGKRLKMNVYYVEESWEDLRRKWDELQRKNK